MRKTKIFRIFPSVLFLCSGSLFVSGQETTNGSTFVYLPTENVLPVIAYQKDCPIKIENVTVLFDRQSKELHMILELRNLTKNKVVQDVGLSQWHLGGGGGDLATMNLKPGLAPGQSYVIEKPKNSEIAPITQGLKEELKLSDAKLSTILLFFVKDVRFTDGSRYSDQKLLDSFLGFANQIEIEDIK